MKKLLGIVALGLLLSGNAYSEKFESNINFKNKITVKYFNQWLLDNGHHQYLDKESDNVRYKLDRSVCKSKTLEEDYNIIKKCIGADGTIIPNSDLKFKKIYPNNLKITIYKNRWQVHPRAEPNRDTLIYYLWKTLAHIKGTFDKTYNFYEIKPSKEPYEFKSNLRENKFVKKQLKKTAILSYLLFEDDKIVIDEVSPKEKLGEFFNDETKFRSNSVGKSMVGYLAGHAICAGYIDSLDTKLNDWPLIEKTLYHDQKLIDLLNMNAGDHKHVTDVAFWDGTSNDDLNLTVYMHMMNGKKKSKSKYNYHGMLPNLVFNYIKFKSGDQFEKFLEDVFQRHVKIKNSVIFFKRKDGPEEGKANSMFYADRYDYLRIAKTVMNDYQKNNCVGKYLKDIHKRRIQKKTTKEFEDPAYNPSKEYGGYFHMGYSGLKKRVVFGMSGYGGNSILIDPETSTITVINSLHYRSKSSSKYHYNEKKLSIKPIKNRKKSK